MGQFYEFFAGGGMARAGLGTGWQCLLANDIDPKKAESYIKNWGDGEFILSDVGALSAGDLPKGGDLVWASFPCQDLSLAGFGAGLQGSRSGTFWPFWNLTKELIDSGRAPSLIVLENVCGAITSHGGKDFQSICHSIASAGYHFGAIVMDAIHFVPQSRPRLFFIAVHKGMQIPLSLQQPDPNDFWTTLALLEAYENLPEELRSLWIWWNMPQPLKRNTVFADLIEGNPQGVRWHTCQETEKLLGMMSQKNIAKVEIAKESRKKLIGAIYKRTRRDADGNKVQRAEIRFDDSAGCLRTPAGGSSRQTIMVVEGNRIRSRLLSPREAARLMGLPDSYALPQNYNDAYHLAGDGVVVPVVRHLAEHILEPIIANNKIKKRKAA
ncbi:MAG: DNA cytosine methyltransferase [Sphingomonadales bacterium]|nr:DNA cytosine methyltransferase [Sphingomonadales bacterium]